MPECGAGKCFRGNISSEHKSAAIGLATFLLSTFLLRWPLKLPAPNQATRKAMDELEQGKGKRFDSADELFEDLGI